MNNLNTKKLIISTLLGGILLFIWNAVSWMALPFHSGSLNTIPDEAMDVANLQNTLSQDGVYHYPGLPGTNDQTMTDIEKKLSEGPRITLMVYKSGPTEFFDPTMFLKSFLINLITAFLLVFILSKTNVIGWNNILMISVGIGVLIGIVTDVALMNWYMFPLSYTLINVLDHVIAFLLLGLLFGKYTFKTKVA